MKPTRAPDADTPEALRRHLDEVNKVLGNISFGSSVPTVAPTAGNSTLITDPDSNMDSNKFIATSPAVPNTEFAVAHNLGRIPVGFIFLGGSNQGAVYKGTTAWTATQVFLKETQGSNTFVFHLV